jgi:hypothetical protein
MFLQFLWLKANSKANDSMGGCYGGSFVLLVPYDYVWKLNITGSVL